MIRPRRGTRARPGTGTHGTALAVATFAALLGAACAAPVEQQGDSPDQAEGDRGDDANGDLTPVTIAQASESLGWMQIYVAREKGYFEEEGLDVEVVIVDGDPAGAAAVDSGSADFGTSTGISQAVARSTGRPFKIIAPLMYQFGVNIVASPEFVQSSGVSAEASLSEKILAMKGHTVGTLSVGGAQDQLLRALIEEEGLKPDQDVEIVALSPYAALFNALRQNEIDFVISGIPNGSAAVADEYAEPYIAINAGEVEQVRGLLHTVVFASESVLSEKADVVEAFTRALEKAMRFTEEDPDGALEAIRPHFSDLSAEALNAAWEENYDAWAKEITVDPESFEVVETLAELTKTDLRDVTYEDLVADLARP